MPSTAKEFFTLMVEPTVKEFIQSPHDLRRGLLAAMVLNHMTDHFAMENFSETDPASMRKQLNKVREDIHRIHPDFQFIQNVSDATKHSKLSIPENKTAREITSSTQISSTPGLFHAPFPEGRFLEAAVVFATLKDGSSKPLLPQVEAVLEIWRSKLWP